MNINVLTFDTLDSTNTEAMKQARLGAPEGLCIVAHKQTAGRGRHGRTWVSEKGAGLYFSIVLRPIVEARYLPLLTLMTGVAVHDTLEEYRLKPDIKWVNDILIDEKKIAGILAEAVESATGLAVIVGIGTNIRSANFPPEIADTATSIEKHSDEIPSKDDLTNKLCGFLTYFYDILQKENGTKEILNEWRRRSTYFSGKHVRVTLERKTIIGITDGLEENGALRVRTDEGVEVIQAGDVERVRSA